MIKRFLIPAFLLACAAGTAQAGTESFTAYTNPAYEKPSFTQTLELSKFNTNLGTLTGITFTVTNNVNGYISIYNSDTLSHTWTDATTSDTVTATGPGSSPATAVTTSTISMASGMAGAGVTNYTPATTSTTTSPSTTVAMSEWHLYQGSGNASVAFSFVASPMTSMGTETGGSGDLYFGGKITAGGSITITYTYTPFAVPEPASMGLLGIGMAGLLSFRRLFKRKAVA
jgi:hypothetical protein